jgi:hypothetical protein
LPQPFGAKFLKRFASMVRTRGIDSELPLISRFNLFCDSHAHDDSPRRRVYCTTAAASTAKPQSRGRDLDVVLRRSSLPRVLADAAAAGVNIGRPPQLELSSLTNAVKEAVAYHLPVEKLGDALEVSRAGHSGEAAQQNVGQ